MSKHLIQQRTATTYADQIRRISSNENEITMAEVAEVLSKVQGSVVEPEGKYKISAYGHSKIANLKSRFHNTGDIFAIPNYYDYNPSNKNFKKWVAPLSTDGNFIIVEDYPVDIAPINSYDDQVVHIIINVQTANMEIRLSSDIGGMFNWVDWGDGTVTELPFFESHIYTNSGYYTIKLTGKSSRYNSARTYYLITDENFANSVVEIMYAADFERCHISIYDMPNNPEISFGYGLTKLPIHNYSWEPKMQNCIIPGTVENIPDHFMYNNDNLELLVLDYGIKTIFNSAFCNCSKIQNIILPDSITDIQDYAFDGCISVGYIKLPKFVKTIGKRAFDGCFSNTPYINAIMIIPESVESIGEGAFSFNGNASAAPDVVYKTNCDIGSAFKYGYLHYLIITTTDSMINLDLSNKWWDISRIYVPDNLISVYKADTNWSIDSNKIYPLSECEVDYS